MSQDGSTIYLVNGWLVQAKSWLEANAKALLFLKIELEAAHA